jgi:hypothetical protein
VNRFYSPQQGRFTQVDPIGMGAAELTNPQSLNLYSYVENDPINSTDPLGLDGLSIALGGPFPTGGKSGGGGGGLKIGPFGLSFSFGGGRFLNFGALQQVKGSQQKASKNIKEKAEQTVVFVSQTLKDTGLGATKGLWNSTIADLCDTVNSPIDACLSIFTDFRFGKAPRFQGSTSGEQGAMLGVGLVGLGKVKLITSGSAITNSERLLTAGSDIPNAGGFITTFQQKVAKIYYRVFSGDRTVGSFLTAVPPKNRAFAQEALSLPPGNTAEYIQEVFVPASTLLQRSRALKVPQWGRFRGGAEQFQLLERIPVENFGPRKVLK